MDAKHHRICSWKPDERLPFASKIARLVFLGDDPAIIFTPRLKELRASIVESVKTPKRAFNLDPIKKALNPFRDIRVIWRHGFMDNGKGAHEFFS